MAKIEWRVGAGERVPDKEAIVISQEIKQEEVKEVKKEPVIWQGNMIKKELPKKEVKKAVKPAKKVKKSKK